MNTTYLNPSIETAQKFSAKVIQDPMLRRIGIVFVAALALATVIGLGIGAVLAVKHFATKSAGSADSCSETDEQKLQRLYQDLARADEAGDQEKGLDLLVAALEILKSKAKEQIQFRIDELEPMPEDQRTKVEGAELNGLLHELFMRTSTDVFGGAISSFGKDELIENRGAALAVIDSLLRSSSVRQMPERLVEVVRNRMIEALNAEIAKRA